jgi:hypothetical protein
MTKRWLTIADGAARVEEFDSRGRVSRVEWLYRP